MQPADFKRFNDDLKAAVVAGVPLAIDLPKSGSLGKTLSLANLQRLESIVAPFVAKADFDNAKPLDQALDSPSEIPRRYRAALAVFGQTRSITPVLDGLSIESSARRQVNRVLWWSLIYLLLLLLVAFLGLAFFSFNIAPAVVDLRTDLLLPAAIRPSRQFDILPWLPLIVTALGCGFLLLLIWMLIGGATRIAMWLGGRQYLRSRIATTTLRVIQTLVSAGTPVEESVSIGCELTGADSTVRGDIQSAIEVADDKTNPMDATQLETVRMLDTYADFLKITGNQRLTHLRVATPIVLVSVIGGVITLSYCLSIFWPIIALLKDLPSAGT